MNIKIEAEAYKKLVGYTKNPEWDDEVGGLLEVEIEDKEIVVKDVILIKQEASLGEFKLDDDKLSRYAENLLKDEPDKFQRIKGWWHKHPVTGWSGQDGECFERLLKNNSDFVIGVVKQSNGEFLWRVDINFIGNSITLDELHCDIKFEDSIDYDGFLKEIKENVTKKTYTYGYGGYGTDWWGSPDVNESISQMEAEKVIRMFTTDELDDIIKSKRYKKWFKKNRDNGYTFEDYLFKLLEEKGISIYDGYEDYSNDEFDAWGCCKKCGFTQNNCKCSKQYGICSGCGNNPDFCTCTKRHWRDYANY